MAELDGVTAHWLASRRDDLNARYAAARQRFPQLDGQAVLAWVARVLPPMAGASASPGPLLGALYDLILLHVGRGRLGPAAGRVSTPLGLLVTETFPRLRERLAEKPGVLVGALSNATENLGERGGRFAAELADVARDVPSADALLDAGALLAWRLGEARLRDAALARAASLPPDTVLRALGVPGFPSTVAPLVCASLRRDGWTAPQSTFRDETLRALESGSPSARTDLERRLGQRDLSPIGSWRLAAALGGFSGFGGEFDDPPLCLEDGTEEDRHRFSVLSTAGVFLLHADAFGCVCRHVSESAAVPATAPPGSAPDNAKATSLLRRRALVAFTTADSFRVRVAVPRRDPL